MSAMTYDLIRKLGTKSNLAYLCKKHRLQIFHNNDLVNVCVNTRPAWRGKSIMRTIGNPSSFKFSLVIPII